VQLAAVGRILQRRINERHMLAGVTMIDPDLVWIGPAVTIGRVPASLTASPCANTSATSSTTLDVPALENRVTASGAAGTGPAPKARRMHGRASVVGACQTRAHGATKGQR